MTPEEMTAAIKALEMALSVGELTCEYAGRRVTFASAAEIQARIAYFRNALAASATAASGAPSRTTYAEFSRD